jgi:hypothetical protein
MIPKDPYTIFFLDRAAREKAEAMTLDYSKSLFRNILHISHLKPKIWREFSPNPMILKDSDTKFFPKVHYVN